MMRLWRQQGCTVMPSRSLIGIGLLALFLSLLPGSVSATPQLMLTPDRPTCKGHVRFTGRDFPPGAGVALGVRQIEPFSDVIVEFATTTIAADGTLALALPVAQMIAECATATPPTAGTRYIINVTPPAKSSDLTLYTQATFTLAGTSAPGLPNTGSGGQAAPSLTLDPAHGSCPILHQRRVTVRGSGFTPGVGTRFILTRDRDGAVTAANTSAGGPPIAADGTYTTTLQLTGCGPDEPISSTFTITVHEYMPDHTPSRGAGASATFTVTAPGTTPGLPNTGGGWGTAPQASPTGAALVLGAIIIAVRTRRRNGELGR